MPPTRSEFESDSSADSIALSGEQAFEPALTWRVGLLFSVLTAIIVVWVEYSVLVVNSTSFNSLMPSITSVFTLAVVCGLLNPVMKVIGSRLALRSREVALLYCMLMVASPVMSIGLAHFLLPTMVSARYFASSENRWDTLFLQYVPKWFGPTDEWIIKNFWEATGAGVPWLHWAKPLALWSVLALALYWVFLCLNTILRRQWIERERLTFPLVYLPLEMVREEAGRAYNSFFRNRLTWIAFVMPIIAQSLPGLHVYYPQVPDLKVKSVPLRPYLTSPPWNAVGHFQLAFYPCMIGFSYLLTTEVSFSCWFFYLLTKVERIVGAALGWTGVRGSALRGFPLEEYQSFGSWLVLIALGLWIGRAHFLQVLRAAVSPERQADRPTPEAPMSYRTAVFGAIAGFVALCAWARAAGLSVLVAAAFFGVYLTLVVALARIRAEAGLGCVSGPLMTQDFLIAIAGSRPIGVRNLTILQHFRWFSREFRGTPTVMPCQLEALKIGHEARLRGRDVTVAILSGIVLTMILGYVATLNVAYLHGGVSMNRWRFLDVPRTPFRTLESLLENPRDVDWYGLTATVIGSAFMGFLTYMRIRFVWWPFHPIGYALAFTKRTVHWIWFPIFLAWAMKTLIIRYGGYKAYRSLMPFFLGLILGDFFIGGVFGVVGALVPRPGYCVFP